MSAITPAVLDLLGLLRYFMAMRKLTFARAAIALGLVAGVLLLNSPAQSCAVFRPFRFEAIKNATLVFKGRVVDYSPRIGTAPATITFKIIEMYRGDRYDTLKLSWPNETFGTPLTWDHSPEAIVAAIRNPLAPALSKEQFAVFQETCSSAFLLEDTAATREKVRALVSQ